MPPKSSKKAATPKVVASRKTSPTKKDTAKKAPVEDPESPPKSPSKKKKASPAKPKSPTKKNTSPAKYKTAMTRAARSASAEAEHAEESNAPATKPRKLTSYDFADNDDDPLQTTEDMIAEFDKRSLTKLDKAMIACIQNMEEQPDHFPINFFITMDVDKRNCIEGGLPISNCHNKIYWRFQDMGARRAMGKPYEKLFADYPTYASGSAAPHSPAKPSSPSKRSQGKTPPSPKKSLARKPSQPEMSRPLRKTREDADEPPEVRTRSTRSVAPAAAGPSGVAKRVASSASVGRPRRARVPVSSTTTLSKTAMLHLKVVEDEAYRLVLEGRPPPPQPRTMEIDQDVFNEALGRGWDRAKEELETAAHTVPEPTKPSSSGRTLGKGPVVEAVPSETKRFPKHGSCISSQNPEYYIDSKGREQKNPFYEPMPTPEIWHRRMPPVFPFGETPYMAKIVSDQINEDLARNHADDDKTEPARTGSLGSLASNVFSKASNVIRSLSPTKEAAKKTQKISSVWDLPDLANHDPMYLNEAKAAAKAFKAAHASPAARRPSRTHH